MCLAVPGRVIELGPDEALVDFQGNRQRVDITLVPDIRMGQWVLVHAGFAITRVQEAEAKKTWEYLFEIDGLEIEEEAGGDRAAESP